MSSVRTIDAGGLQLALEDGLGEARLRMDDPQTAPLAAVLNAGADGTLPGLAEALEQGGRTATPIERVARPRPGDEFPAERERWRELTGDDPGGDVYVVGTAYTAGVMIVPRAALQAGLMALRRLREGPPRTDLHGAWLAEMEERAAAIDRLEHSDDVDDRARAAVKRRLLLAELDLLPGDLDAAAYPLLEKYRCAARARQRYARGTERTRVVPGAETSFEPAVSLDWFRQGGEAPRDWADEVWLARAEAALLAADVPPEQGEGELLVRDGSGWISITWRREDGSTPVVLRAAPA